MEHKLRCWCGSEEFTPFSADYAVCRECGTLVYTGEIEPSIANGTGDPAAFYGKEYWLDNQREQGRPDIAGRARSDLFERCLHWLGAVLKYELPPGRSLELGSSHGGFVALLRQAGFDSHGLELSPWVVDFARQTFGVPMLLGPVEDQPIPPGSLDFIVLMDVLEHLPNPVGTMRHCLSLLKPDGALFIQTPCFRPGQSLADLEKAGDPFLSLLLPQEHLFLFSETSAARLFKELGAPSVRFEPAFFSQYDMFLVVSRVPLEAHPWPDIERWLESAPERRILLSLLDLFKKDRQLEKSYAQADLDRIGRQEIIEKINAQLQISDDDRAARLALIEKLNEQMMAIEAANQKNVSALQNQIAQQQAALAQRDREVKALRDMIQSFRRLRSYRVLRRLGRMTAIEKKYAALEGPGKAAASPEPAAAKKLKRIAVDLTPVRPGGENGGAKLITLELLRQLSRKVAPDCEFILLTADDSHAELADLDAPNVHRVCVVQKNPPPAAQPAAQAGRSGLVHAVGKSLETLLPRETYVKVYSAYRGRRQPIKSNSLIKQLDVDLVFCPFTAPFYYDPQTPIVIIVYDLQSLYYPQFFSIEETINARRYFEQSCKVASRLVAISEYTRQTILEKAEIELERVTTIPCVLYSDRARIDPARAGQILQKYGLSENGYLFYPANFWLHKNHAMLLTAFGMYLRDHPQSDLKLVLSGAPDRRMDAVQLAVQRMGLDRHVILPGYLKGDELTGILQSSLALIFPSLFEGFGVPVLEAMAFGKPVLCSSVTSLPEIGGDAVLYFDPRRPDEIVKAIDRIVEEPALRHELVQAGLKQAATFARPEDWARQYMQVFVEAAYLAPTSSNWVDGISGDGWISQQVDISFVDEGAPRRLELDLEVAPWMPRDRVSVTIHNPAARTRKTYRLPRGKRTTLTVPLPPQSGKVLLSFNPAVQPSALGIGPDNRFLSCLCHSCRIVGQDNAVTTLYEFNQGQ